LAIANPWSVGPVVFLINGYAVDRVAVNGTARMKIVSRVMASMTTHAVWMSPPRQPSVHRCNRQRIQLQSQHRAQIILKMKTRANTIPNIVVQRRPVCVNTVTVNSASQKAVRIVARQLLPILLMIQRQSQRRLRLAQIIPAMPIHARCILLAVVQRMTDCANGAILRYVKAKVALIVASW